MKALRILGWVGIGLAGVTALACVLGLAVMWLWNWLMPALFGLPVLTFAQAVGLLVLCHLLFRGPAVGRHSGRMGEHGHARRAAFLKRVRCHLGRPEEEAETVEAPSTP